jgi:hypothetical protein
MLTPSRGPYKGAGQKKIPQEWSVETGLLLALLRRSPRTWFELFHAGFTFLDVYAAIAELNHCGGYGVFSGPVGICLDRTAERRCNCGKAAS